MKIKVVYSQQQFIIFVICFCRFPMRTLPMYDKVILNRT